MVKILIQKKESSLGKCQKLEVIEKFENGETVDSIMKTYAIAKSTIYKLKQTKPSPFNINYWKKKNCYDVSNKRSLHKPKSELLDERLIQCFLQKRSEGMAISGPMIIAEVKCLNEELNLDLSVNVEVGGWGVLKNAMGSDR